jgi:hypothetical protein
MSFEQRGGDEACQVFRLADIDAYIQGLVLELGNRLEVGARFRFPGHWSALLSANSGACRAERPETVDVVYPPTYQRLAMAPHILMRGPTTSPIEGSGVFPRHG